MHTFTVVATKSIARVDKRSTIVPTASPDRPMDVCTLHRYRTRLGLSKRACRWIAYVFGQLYPRYLSSSIRRKHPVRGFIVVKEEAQMLRFSLVTVPLPPNWKETNSFSPNRWQHRRPHEDASSSTNSNVSNSTTFRQKLDFRTITT